MLDFDVLSELRLEPMPPTRFLSPTAQHVKTSRDDAGRFHVLLAALEAADVASTDARELLRATAACLHLGAIAFDSVEGTGGGSEGTTVVSGESAAWLHASADLLGVDASALQRALTCKQVESDPHAPTPREPAC